MKPSSAKYTRLIIAGFSTPHSKLRADRKLTVEAYRTSKAKTVLYDSAVHYVTLFDKCLDVNIRLRPTLGGLGVGGRQEILQSRGNQFMGKHPTTESMEMEISC